ncbi:MAG: Do family serine endopeptidase [Pyrinomonadaceae bacterium]|nr:Do family serine endopeptidase [Acidobacteriota bacterium]MDQ3490495.1 Do family serine endopeptidase [Acidobacteriota bacterium]
MFNRNSFVILLLVSVSIFSGCRTGLFGGQDVAVAPNQSAAPPAPIVVDGVRTSYADVVGNTAGAVVRIEAEGRAKQQSQQPFPFGDEFFRQDPGQGQNRRPQLQRGLGSGVIVSADGTILTNAHVIDGADKITVLMADNKSFEAKLIGADKPSDLAVLKIESQDLPFLNLGNSDSVRVGDIVLAIGNPLGIGQSVTAGIISAKGRRTGLSDGQSFEDFLQTDAPINRGNSGGALVNLNSELIGINSQILSSPGAAGGNIGIGFAIPSNMAKSVMDQLLKDGRVRRGKLGIGIQNITDEAAQALELKDKSGVLVNQVLSGSAAEKAGIKLRDIITAINGERIEDSNILRNKVAGTLPGTEIRVTVLRDGTTQELTATLEEFETEDNSGNTIPQNGQNGEAERPNGKLGLSLQPVTPETAKQLGLTGDSGGLVVTDVDQNGVAAEAGIARGDVVLEINRRSVDSVEAVQSALNSAGDRPVLLLISRKGQTIYLTVRPQ